MIWSDQSPLHDIIVGANNTPKRKMKTMKLKKDLLVILIGFFLFAMIGIYVSFKAVSTPTLELTSTVTDNEARPSFPRQSRIDDNRPVYDAGASKSAKTEASEPSSGGALAECADDCQKRIVKLLASGAQLSPADAELILQNAAIFAPLLVAQPESLANLLVSLQKDEGGEDDSAQFAAHVVFETLSDEERSIAGQSLLSDKNPSFRIIALRLAKNEITHDAQTAQAFGSLIKHEKDARVLVTALNTISQQKETGPYVYETVIGLNELINFHESDHIRGNALVAKAKVVQSTEETKADIQSALLSQSTDLQKFGLQAFAVTRERHNFLFDSGRQWTNDEESIRLLQALISNPDLDSETRQLAGELVIAD